LNRALGEKDELYVRHDLYSKFDYEGPSAPIENRAGSINDLPPKGPTLDHEVMKGSIAEALVEQLIRSNGYSVFRYGMENTVPGVMNPQVGEGRVLKDIKRMPDIVVLRDQDTFFIDVRFRASEEFDRDDLPYNYPSDNAYIVVVSKEHIKCATVQELNEGNKITSTSCDDLADRKEFGLDQDTVEGLGRFASRLFENV
jgi:hypothetical protein